MEKSKIDFSKFSRNEVAQAFGVHPQTVSRWVSAGAPRNGDLTFNLPDLIAWAVNRAREDEAPNEETDEAKKWLTAFRRERALQAKMEREKLEGELFSKSDILEAWLNRYMHFKKHVLSWSKRLPGRLAGLNKQAIRELLEEEAGYLLALLSRPGKFVNVPESNDQEDEAANVE